MYIKLHLLGFIDHVISCDLILMYIKLHLLGFIDHVISCDLNKNSWGNEQNNIETHWDSFVSIYYFTCFVTFEAQKKKV